MFTTEVGEDTEKKGRAVKGLTTESQRHGGDVHHRGRGGHREEGEGGKGIGHGVTEARRGIFTTEVAEDREKNETGGEAEGRRQKEREGSREERRRE